MSFLVTAAATAATTAATAGVITGGVGAAITAGSLGGAAAGIGAGAATAGALGAGVGAVSAAAQGQDVGKGALMGAASGVVTAGVGGGMGAVGAGLLPAGAVAGAAGGAAGAAAGGEDIGKGALIGAGTGAVTGTVAGIAGAGGGGGATAVEGAPVSPTPTTPTPTPTPTPTTGGTLAAVGKAPAPTPGVFSDLADSAAAGLSKTGTPISGDQLSGGLKGLGTGAVTNYEANSMVDSQAANSLASQQDKARGLDAANQGNSGLAALAAAGLPSKGQLPEGTGPMGGLGNIGRATGGITALAHGGQIPLEDGAYIIPADVVSALGNGSSKAGADYLRRLMIEVRKEAVNLQGMGAAKKHVA